MSQTALFARPDQATPATRRTWLCAVVLALLTGLVLGQLDVASRQDFGSPALVSSANAAPLAVGYYDAINRYLRGGSSGQLETLILPDYTGHPVERERGETRDELLARLDGLKRSFPELQLRAEVISADRHLVVAHVAVAGTAGGTLAGIPIEVEEAPPAVEVLRFEGDLLVERWSTLHWPATLDVQGSTVYSTAAANPLQPRLERISLEPQAQMELASGTIFLIETETGVVQVQGQARVSTPVVEGLDGATAVHSVGGDPVTLHTGEVGLTGRNGPYIIRALNDEPATFLFLQIENVIRQSDVTSMQSQALPIQRSVNDSVVLASALEIESDAHPWIVSIGEVTLANGSVLAAHQVDGVEIVVVESGELRTRVGECATQCIATTAGTSRYVTGETVLQTDEGFSTAQGGTVAYEPGASGPVTFLMITIARPRVGEAYS